MAAEIFPWIYVCSLAFALVSAVVTSRHGQAFGLFRTVAPWVAWVFFMIAQVMGAIALSEGPGNSWGLALFPLGSSATEIRVGIALSSAGLAATVIVGLVLGYLFLVEPVFAPSTKGPQKSPFRGLAWAPGAATLSMAAVSLGWLSDGLWGIALGQVLALASGWVLLQSAGVSGSDGAEMSTSFMRERIAGVCLTLLGLSVFLASGQASLLWSESGGFSAERAPLGIVLVFLGSLLQMGVFPGLGWSTLAGEKFGAGPAALQLVSSPSAWVAFALLYRMRIDVDSSQLGGWLVAPTLLFAAITAWFSVSSVQLRTKLLGLSGASTGVSAALVVMAGGVIGAASFFSFQILLWATAAVLRGRESEDRTFDSMDRVLRAILMLAWSGGVGFVSGSVATSALSIADRGTDLVILALAWLMMAFAAQTLLAAPSQRPSAKESRIPPLWRLIPAAVLLIFCLSIFWVGDFQGGFVAAQEQAIGPAWAPQFFGGVNTIATQTAQLIVWAWMVALAVLILLGVPEKILKSGALSWGVAAEGYRLRAIVAFCLDQGVRSVEWLNKRLWIGAVARALEIQNRALSGASRNTVLFDEWLVSRIERFTQLLVEVPAKALQLLQGGSMQTYLLFTVGFVLLLLVHFWGHIAH